MLDALIAGQDRHDENWAVLRGVTDPTLDCLSPSYDHATSLGFQLHDAYRRRRLQAGTLPLWAAAGIATRFEHDPVVGAASLVAFAVSALRRLTPEHAAFWINRVDGLPTAAVTDVLAAVPGLSDAARTFAIQLISINRGRLLDEYRARP